MLKFTEFHYFLGRWAVATIHENIRKIRDFRQLSQQDMAERLDMSVSAYGKIERGETSIIHSKLSKIAEILEVDILDLLKNNYYNSIHGSQNNASAIGIIQHQNNYHSDSELLHKIELLESRLRHQQDIIESKDREIELLRKLIE